MQSKIFFFDIDHTLCDKNFNVSQSTIDAIQQLKKNGHIVCLSTGRARYSMMKYAKLFDIHHYVCSEGCSAYFNDEQIFSSPMPKSFIEEVLKRCDEAHIPVGMISDDNNGVTILDERVTHFKDELNLGKYFLSPNYYLEKDIYKLYIYAKANEREVLSDLTSIYPSYLFSYGMAFAIREKERGIDAILKKLKANKEDIVVVGDSINDVTMFQYAHTKIAMGNAIQALKDIATFITKSVDDDGIAYALKHFGWI